MANKNSFKAYDKKDLSDYLRNDFILRELKKHVSDSKFASHRWLLDIPAKRMIYADIYGELLNSKNKRILDIGGGFCGLSRQLIKKHDYTLVDTMDHDDHKVLKKIGKFWRDVDWADFKPKGKYDYIIANDLFPNTDQRLRDFIKKYKPYGKKIILTLTCHEGNRYYKVKRIDADEILTVILFNAALTSDILSESMNKKINLIAVNPEKSIFKNGRTVYKIIA